MSSQLTLTKAIRRQIAAIEAVFAPWGLAYELATDGPHLVLRVAGPKGGHWRLIVACTPRDADAAVQIARQKAQRLVREINRRLGL